MLRKGRYFKTDGLHASIERALMYAKLSQIIYLSI